MASDMRHIDAMRALHNAIINNDTMPDVGSILSESLPSQAHSDLLHAAAMREAQMAQSGSPSNFDDSLLGAATHAVAVLPDTVAAKVASLLHSDDPHHVAAGVKFLDETARERQQRMEEDALGAASVQQSPETRAIEKNVGIGLSRLPMRMLGAPVDMYTSQGLETLGANQEDRHPVMGSDWLIDQAIKYRLAPERTGSLAESVGDIAGSLFSPSSELRAVAPLGKVLKAGKAAKSRETDCRR